MRALVFKPDWRDSSEINHCLLLISFGKSRFKATPFEIRGQMQKEVISAVEAWKTVFVERDMGVYTIDLQREICKQILKLDFTSYDVMEPLPEFGLGDDIFKFLCSTSWPPSLILASLTTASIQSTDSLRGTVSRDFLLKFFFMNHLPHLPPSPWK